MHVRSIAFENVKGPSDRVYIAECINEQCYNNSAVDTAGDTPKVYLNITTGSNYEKK